MCCRGSLKQHRVLNRDEKHEAMVRFISITYRFLVEYKGKAAYPISSYIISSCHEKHVFINDLKFQISV